MIEVDWKPKDKILRQFGWIALFGFGLVGAIVAWKTGAFAGKAGWTAPGIIWGLAVLCPLLSLTAPRLLRFIYLPLMAIALPIGFVLGTVILLLLFFLLFTPLALWFKLIRRDELNRKLDPQAKTYWIDFTKKRAPESYYRQF